MLRTSLFLLMAVVLFSCKHEEKNLIDEDKLGFIDADLKSVETNLETKAKYHDGIPGSSEKLNRAFENAPPLIPHSTKGFFPIKIKNNICLTCHMPDKAEAAGAIELPETHFMNWRPMPEEIEGVFTITEEKTVPTKNHGRLNNSYFNCSQCHVPQTNVTVDIENLFTPEFRDEFGLEKSNLNKSVNEGINK